MDGTATSPSDYVAVAGGLPFADGETIKSFDVTIVDDNSFEGTESLTLSLANASGGAGLGAQSTATLNILNDDVRSPGLVHFDSQSYTVTEGASLTITILRDGGSNGQIAVELSSIDGTARVGSDYDALSTVIQFADGETSNTVTFASIEDTTVESTEDLQLTLSKPSGGAIVSAPVNVTINITDNDQVTPRSDGGGGGAIGPWWLLLSFAFLWSQFTTFYYRRT